MPFVPSPLRFASAFLGAVLLAPSAGVAQEASPDSAFLGRTQTSVTGAAAAAPVPPVLERGVDVLRANEAPQTAPPNGVKRMTGETRPEKVPGVGPGTAEKPGEGPETAPPTDFQRFAATSVGKLLPIFGHALFTEAPSTFAPVEDLAPAADYVVGTGDEIVIRGWGQVEIDVRSVVTREGTISIPKIGVVSVAGVRYQDLQTRLRQAIGRYFKRFDLSVSLGRLRSIQVFVMGQAQRPGLYTVSSLSTLMNALFASGGPAPTGSVRRIQVRRGEALVGEFDLYDLLLRGDKSKDQRLQTGDVIFIPPVGALAAIAGRVKTPAIFELREQSTLADLVDYAGGLTTTASADSIQLERLDRKLGRVVQELPWGDGSMATTLRDGDVVMLRSLSQKYDNAVTLRGSVAFPVRTQWRPGLRVSDLIPDRNVLIPESYWERVAARAYGEKNDSADDEAGLAKRTRPEKPVRVENLLSEVNWDYAVVERLDRTRLEPKLLSFNLRRAVVDRDPASDLLLEPGDVVTVFSQKDLMAPADRRTYFVRVEGEVNTAGVYQVRPGETLRQVLERAGGLAPGAYLFGAEFTRERVREEQQLRLEEVATRAEKELERAAVERLARATNPEDAASTRAQLDTQRSAIARLKALKATGRMVLEVDPNARRVEDLPELMLEDGDRLFVPTRYSTVGVYGSVYNQANLIYRPGKNVGDYLAKAGGPTRSADDGSTYVLRADGSVMSRRQSGWFSKFDNKELMPNDAIVVPEEYAPTSWIRELKDWSQIFYQFGLGVAALKVLAP